MKRYSALLPLWAVMLGTLALPAHQVKESAAVRYFPARDSWESRPPAELGLNPAKLDAAVQYSIKNQNQNTKNLAEDILNTFRNEAPYNKLFGPTQERTGANGVVIRHGYVAAESGDTKRADMTFSVTKTFLSTAVGLAFTRGIIKDLKTPVARGTPSGVDLFTSEHNYIDREHDIVAVVRWIRNANGFITQLMDAIEK